MSFYKHIVSSDERVLAFDFELGPGRKEGLGVDKAHDKAYDKAANPKSKIKNQK